MEYTENNLKDNCTYKSFKQLTMKENNGKYQIAVSREGEKENIHIGANLPKGSIITDVANFDFKNLLQKIDRFKCAHDNINELGHSHYIEARLSNYSEAYNFIIDSIDFAESEDSAAICSMIIYISFCNYISGEMKIDIIDDPAMNDTLANVARRKRSQLNSGIANEEYETYKREYVHFFSKFDEDSIGYRLLDIAFYIYWDIAMARNLLDAYNDYSSLNKVLADAVDKLDKENITFDKVIAQINLFRQKLCDEEIITKWIDDDIMYCPQSLSQMLLIDFNKAYPTSKICRKPLSNVDSKALRAWGLS